MDRHSRPSNALYFNSIRAHSGGRLLALHLGRLVRWEERIFTARPRPGYSAVAACNKKSGNPNAIEPSPHCARRNRGRNESRHQLEGAIGR
jgi:hypothetical protein